MGAHIDLTEEWINFIIFDIVLQAMCARIE